MLCVVCLCCSVWDRMVRVRCQCEPTRGQQMAFSHKLELQDMICNVCRVELISPLLLLLILRKELDWSYELELSNLLTYVHIMYIVYFYVCLADVGGLLRAKLKQGKRHVCP